MKSILIVLVFMLSKSVCSSQIIATFDCNPPISTGVCNLVNNPNLISTNPVIQEDAFSQNLIAGWNSSHGSPDWNRIFVPPFPNCNYINLGYSGIPRLNEQFYEGVVTRIQPTVIGRRYQLSFFEAITSQLPNYYMGKFSRFNIVLFKCSDQNQYNLSTSEIPPLPRNHQMIFCETTRNLHETDWKQIVTSFQAQDAYDMIRIYPEPTLAPDMDFAAWFHFGNLELLDVTDFDAGSPLYSGCTATISPSICGVINTVYTWLDPQNTLIQQNSSPELVLDMNTASSGTYTLQASVPSATVTNNTCSENNPIFTSTVEVKENCNCNNGLAVNSAVFQYTTVGPYSINLSGCDISNFCLPGLNGDDFFDFVSTSNQPNGNLWSIKVIPNQLYKDPSYQGFYVNGLHIPYPQCLDFVNYSSLESGNFTLFNITQNASVFEIKLFNSITQSTIIFRVKIVSQSGPDQANFYCVNSGTSFCSVPHKLIYAVQPPGYLYNWSLPLNMVPCTTLNGASISWTDNNYDYLANPNPVAYAHIENIFGCPPNNVNILINPDNCNTLSKSTTKFERADQKQSTKSQTELIVKSSLSDSKVLISAKKRIRMIQVYTTLGQLIMNQKNMNFNGIINLTGLSRGPYIIKVTYEDFFSESRSIFKGN